MSASEIMQTDRGRELFQQFVEFIESQEPSAKQSLYTVKEVAKLFDRSPTTIYDNCRMGRIRSIKRGRSRFIPHDEVERLRETHFELLPPLIEKTPESLWTKYFTPEQIATYQAEHSANPKCSANQSVAA